MADDPPHAGPVFADFIEQQLKIEYERRDAINARGISVLTTSGTLVTLIFALGALVSGLEAFKPPTVAVWLLVPALVAFVLAAFFGLLANRLVKYQVVRTGQLRTWRDHDKKWNDDADKARRVVAGANINTIETLRTGNDRKAELLEWALLAQLSAILLLACAVGVTLAAAV